MTPLAPPVLSESARVLCVICIFLIPWAGAGISLVNTGLGRSRSAAHAMLTALCVMALAAIVTSVCGFAWQGYLGRPAHTVMISGKPWNWVAGEPLFLRRLDLDGSPASLAACFAMLSAGLAAVIPLGAAADRWRLGAACASATLLAGCTYPLFAHWVWAGGWLAQLGVNYGLGRGFMDAGGSGSIQALGGLTALAIAWILGARRGKYAPDGSPAAIPGHHAIFVLFGCLVAWAGWLGLNSAGAILFAASAPGNTILIVVNTTLSASAAALAVAIFTRLRFGKPDASLTANGWVGGLAASSAGCASVVPAAAIMIGMVAGAVVVLAVEALEFWLKVDDPGGAVSVHAVAGLWGVLALGLFARVPGAASGQWLAQLVGVATLIGFVLPLTFGLNWLLNRIYPLRVAVDGEREGMDLYELGAGAYPEFATHSDEFMPR